MNHRTASVRVHGKGLVAGLGLVWVALAAPLTAAAQTASAAVVSAPVSVPQLPLESFASLPALSNVTISPDGKQIAAQLHYQDNTTLITRVIGQNGKPKVILMNDPKEFSIGWARWVNNDRLLVSIRFNGRRYYDKTVETRLLSIKSDGTGLINLVKPRPEARKRGETEVSQLQDRVVDWMPDDGKHILLQLSDPGDPTPAVYKVDVETGSRGAVKGGERNVYEWMADVQHRVRVAWRVIDGNTAEDSRREASVCDPDGDNWRVIWNSRVRGGMRPIGFGKDPQELYVLAEHNGRDAVFSLRLDQPGMPRTLRFSHPSLDVSG
jgi:hypothetical protein